MHLLRRWITLISIVTMIALIGLAGFTSRSKAHGGGTTTRVSVASDGLEGNDDSLVYSISGDGCYIVFTSYASNLVANDTNGVRDIFVHECLSNITRRVSVSSGGSQSNGDSFINAISTDGHHVVFDSEANNLIPDDTNKVRDIFAHNLLTGQTTLVSVDSNGIKSNGSSYTPTISADGRYIAFYSVANNLIVGDTNNVSDAFLHDRLTGETHRISVASDGTQGNNESNRPSISDDGRYVVFDSMANNLIENDTNNARDIFVRDRLTGQITRVSITSNGLQSNGESNRASISGDGRFIAFYSVASNLVSSDMNNMSDIFLHDRNTEQTIRVSVSSDGIEGNGGSFSAHVSGDGQFVAFTSSASNLVLNDTNNVSDIFVYQIFTGETTRLSLNSNGTQSNNESDRPYLSEDGRYVVFDSTASNLVPSDTNFVRDVFVRDQGEQETPTPISTATRTPIITNTPPPGATFTPTVIASPPTQPESVYVPFVLKQHAYATPAPTPTPAPTCESLDHEPNNRFIDANNNLPLCQGSAVIGTVSAGDIDDIYRLTVEQAGTVVVSLTNLPAGADYDLYLYDARGGSGQIGVSNTSGSANEEIRVTVPNGRYYIRVVSLQYAGANTYQLRWVRE